jgi:hypothetical protein
MVFRSSLTVRFVTLFPILDVSRVDAVDLLAHSWRCDLAHRIPPCCSHRPSALLRLEPFADIPTPLNGHNRAKKRRERHGNYRICAARDLPRRLFIAQCVCNVVLHVCAGVRVSSPPFVVSDGRKSADLSAVMRAFSAGNEPDKAGIGDYSAS